MPDFFDRLLKKILLAKAPLAFVVGFVVLVALFSVKDLSVDLFPPLNFPVLNVVTELAGYNSLQMEQQVTLPIESGVGSIPGVRHLWSSSGTGISMVTVEFDWGMDMIQARQLVNQALAELQGQLPGQAVPSVESLSAVLSLIEGYSLQGGKDLGALRELAIYDLKPRLQRIPGVYMVEVIGGDVPQFEVRPYPARMIQYGVGLDDLRNALENNNVLGTPGALGHGAQELVLYSDGQFKDVSEIAETVVSVKRGFSVRVKDLAWVGLGRQYQRGESSENGVPAVMITVAKQPGSDTLAVAKLVSEEIARFRKELPSGVSVENYYDQAQLVGDSVASVKESVLIGAILVILVLAFFLRSWRATVLAALSIPISVMTALLLMRYFNIPLNIMSLGGLAIGTGIIVDDTVVVLENIFRWISTPSLRRKKFPLDVIVAATREVLAPVWVSTLTNVGIFLPMIFVEGFTGKLFSPVSLTVTFALLASFLVSQTVIPSLSLHWLGSKVHEVKEGGLQRFYRGLLKGVLDRPGLTLLFLALPVLGAILALRQLDTGFLPDLDEGAILVNTLMPPGVSLQEAHRLNLKLEHWLMQMPGVERVARRTGHAPGAEDTDNLNHSDIMVKLRPKSERGVNLGDWIDGMADKTATLASINVDYLMPLADKINDAVGGVPADLGVNLYGPDLEVLHNLAGKVQMLMQGIFGLNDIRPPADLPAPALKVSMRRTEAGRLGIAEDDVNSALAAASQGLEVTVVRQGLKEIPVVIRFGEPDQTLDLRALRQIPLRTAGGNTVPLEQIADLSFSEIPSQIDHDHQTRRLLLTANVRGRRVEDAAIDLEKGLNGISFPDGYSWDFSGKYKSQTNALDNLEFVLGLAILVVASILWFEFRSWRQVLLILLTIPLAAVGAAFSLSICKLSLNVSSMIGAVLLVGIVVRNGIMLLDYVNRELALKKGLREAIESAALKRVRPIIMTATVTLLGMLPLALGWGSGSELQRPLAVAVCGGILSSTLLTFLVLPAATRLLLKERPVT